MTALAADADERPSYGEVMASVERTKSSLEDAAEEIVWQIERCAWEVLGHPDWNTMREAVYGGAAFMVPRAERPELMTRLRRAGLTQQEIAETAGVSHQTVGRDLNVQVDNEPPPIITNARGQQRPASYAPRPEPDPVAAAVAEFPDLAYYTETDRVSDAMNMADDLRRYRDRGELDQRLDTLRRSIAVDRSKRDGSYQFGTTAVMDAEAGEYRMAPLPTVPQPNTSRTCPTCNGRGSIEE